MTKDKIMLHILKNHAQEEIETEGMSSWLRNKLKYHIPGLNEDEVDEHIERFENQYAEAIQCVSTPEDVDVNALARETLESARQAYGVDDVLEDNFFHPYVSITEKEDGEFVF